MLRPALNVSLLGSDFADLPNQEIMAKQLFRLAAVFGDPFGRSPAMLTQMAGEWLRALSDIPTRALDAAVSEWVKTGKQWPKPSDIRELATAAVDKKVRWVADIAKVHESRIKPCDAVRAFNFKPAFSLRKNPNWAAFLDSVHLSVEHNYFAEARLDQYENILLVAASFHADWIRRNLQEQLDRHFGCRVYVRFVK